MAKTQADSDLEKPEEMFAWMFTAGIPDPRDPSGQKFPHQPLIPPMMFPAISQMLYDMGARFHPELQKKWVNPRSGPTRNFEAWGVTDIAPQAAEMLADQFPERAAELAKLTPEQATAEVQTVASKLLENLERMRALQQKHGGTSGGPS